MTHKIDFTQDENGFNEYAALNVPHKWSKGVQ